MKKQEFLNKLKASLSGSIPESDIQAHINYYSGYIDTEVRMGKSEKEAIKSLGDPRLIAKTIMNTQSVKSEYHENQKYENRNDNERSFSGKGFNVNYNEEGRAEYRYGRFKLNSWYGKLLGIFIAVLFFVLIFIVLGGITAILVKLAVPILVIVLIAALLRRII